MPNNQFTKTETPCVGICSTIYGDHICRGCFRHYQDVIDWNTYPDSKKLEILETLDQHISNVMQNKVEIFDSELLQSKCTHFHVKIRPTWSPYTWAHALLREGIDRIQNLEKYGLQAKAPYVKMRLTKLVELIDDEIHHALDSTL